MRIRIAKNLNVMRFLEENLRENRATKFVNHMRIWTLYHYIIKTIPEFRQLWSCYSVALILGFYGIQVSHYIRPPQWQYDSITVQI